MLRLLTWSTSALLLLFNLRRLAFLLAAAYDLLRPRLRQPESGLDLCHVLILVPLRNEVRSLPGLFTSLLTLDYPPPLLTIGLIDDGSTDGSGQLMDEFASAHPHVVVLHNSTSLGKANALNAGLRQWPQGDLVMVYDADARPQPDSLRQIVAAFDDPLVAGAGGLIRPRNGLATPSATYSAIERLVHQQVTLRAKDRLDLRPAILGSHCAYRRSDLQAAGGFPGGALLEDSQLTVDFARSGRRTRFLPCALATDHVPETLRGYWRQHVRWGRGFHEVAEKQARAAGQISGFSEETGDRRAETGDRRAETGDRSAEAGDRRAEAGDRSALVVRLELWLFALGYLDRLALMMACGLLVQKRATRARSSEGGLLAAIASTTLLLPYAQIMLAFAAERASLSWWLRLPLVPFFFLIDIAAALWSTVLSLARRPRVWQQTER